MSLASEWNAGSTNARVETVESLTDSLSRLQPDLRHRDEKVGLQACQLALSALRRGDYGVAALVMDQGHHIWAEGDNCMLSEGLNSSGHAEMRALDRFERLPQRPAAREMTLLVTLEPCPMCLTRALYAGVGEVVYLVEDENGGMVHRRDSLPPALAQLASLSQYRRAEVSAPLQLLAERLAFVELARRRKALMMAQGVSQ